MDSNMLSFVVMYVVAHVGAKVPRLCEIWWWGLEGQNVM